jgi:hypothetical protein
LIAQTMLRLQLVLVSCPVAFLGRGLTPEPLEL